MPSEPTGNSSSEPAPVFADTGSFDQGVADTGPPANAGPASTPSSPAAVAVETASATRKSLIGQTFDDVELLEELGQGGMGIVYKARQISLDRLVAVKLLLTEYFLEPVRVARFQTEARTAASLTHPNIVQVYQVGECAFGHYLAMEFVDGHSLEYFIYKGRISLAAALHLMIKVAKAVHYAHSKGIVHRDLKPANIMIDRSHRPVVMDFGIAKFVGQSSTLTQQGVVIGTPAFMAPEQAGEAHDQVGPWSDVYSLGAILYLMLTGRVPFDEGSPLRTVLKVIGPDLPPPVRSLCPEVPEGLEQLCMKCLSKQPADRYASAQALAEELRRFRAFLKKRGSTLRPRRHSHSTMRASLPAVFLVAVATGKCTRIPRSRAVVGRTSACDVVLRAADVSKRHCQIIVEADQVLVEDLASANGTYVNDQPIARAELKDGDRLRIADYEFLIRLDQPQP